MISQAMEDYLKAIYQLTTDNKRVSTSQLSKRIQCSAASVTNMLRKLSKLKLVNYAPYRGVTLTSPGKKIALEIIRHHRLIELYLSEILGYSWDKVHAEAEKLEHVISEQFEEKIDEVLGYPTLDPHGHPIPTKEGTIASDNLHVLWDIEDGVNVKVQRVSDRYPEVLRYLASMGIFPDITISVIKKSPFSGPIHVKIDGEEHSLSKKLANQIFVTPV